MSALAEHYAISSAAAQKHVAVLERAGLDTKVTCGREQLVRVDHNGLRQARGLLDEYGMIGRARGADCRNCQLKIRRVAS